MTKEDDLKRAREQAAAQFNSARRLVEQLRQARSREDAYDDEDHARTAIEEDALSVSVRSGWHSPGDKPEPEEYNILLCTGGPAVRIIGDLDGWKQPESARIEYQDWFTPWTEWRGQDTPDDMEEVLLDYARCFFFGE